MQEPDYAGPASLNDLIVCARNVDDSLRVAARIRNADLGELMLAMDLVELIRVMRPTSRRALGVFLDAFQDPDVHAASLTLTKPEAGRHGRLPNCEARATVG